MTLKRGKLTLDKQTVRSLRARSSIRAGAVDPNASTSGFNKCIPGAGDSDPVPAPGADGFAGKVQLGHDTSPNAGKLLV